MESLQAGGVPDAWCAPILACWPKKRLNYLSLVTRQAALLIAESSPKSLWNDLKQMLQNALEDAFLRCIWCDAYLTYYVSAVAKHVDIPDLNWK